MVVASGVHPTVLVIGVEKMRDKSTAEGLLSRAAAGHPLYNRGETAPVLFAPFATRHMHELGTTAEMLAAVAVKNHHNGCLDPYAHFQSEITVDQVLAFARPFATLFGFSIAVPRQTVPRRSILTTPERARDLTDSPCLRIGVRARNRHPSSTRSRLTSDSRPPPSPRDARFDMAGLSPSDMDMAEVHDCFTITEILDIEDIGFVEKGKAARDRRGPDRHRRQDPREPIGRSARQGPPDRRNRRRPDMRVLLAATRGGGRPPGGVASRSRTPAQRRWPRIGASRSCNILSRDPSRRADASGRERAADVAVWKLAVRKGPISALHR